MAHIHEKIDFTTDVFIVHQNKVLLRMHEKYHMWLAVGGHVELDEDPATAAKRECVEEVGLVIRIIGEEKAQTWGNRKEIARPQAMNMHPVSDTHTHISFVYYATSESNAVVPENETDQWMWLAKEEVEAHSDINPDIKIYCSEALRLATQYQ